METEIWLVRHGQSAANAGLPTDDPAAIPLTDKGHVQSREFAQWLPHGAYAVWTSSYVRAQETALPTLQRLELSAQTHDDLHEFITLCPERCAGTSNLERMPWIEAYWKRSDPDFRDGASAETFREFSGRVRKVRNNLHQSQGKLLVFGHGMFFALWIWQELGFDDDNAIAIAAFRRFQLGLPMPNTGVYRLVRTAAGWQLKAHAQRLRALTADARPDIAIQ